MEFTENRFKVLVPFLLIFFFAFLKVSNAFSKPVEKVTLTPNYSAQKYKHMLFGGMPSIEDLKAAKEKEKVEVVIDVRGPSEVPESYRAQVESLGLAYFHVPLMSDNKIDPRAAQKLEEIHKKTHHQKQLLHCASGNRVAAWFATHLVKKDKLSLEDSLKTSRELGLTKKELEKAVADYVQSTP